ncbi:MAG: tetratricopeptide repeat protein [Nitrospirae bacterium]|nr:tetratricopeptide repeat protein [Nitrospirota bacterium]
MRLLILVLMTSLLIMACSKEPEKTAEQEPVTERTLFEEVKTQTIKNPGDPEAWYHLADLYERSAMYREEADALHKVIAIDPQRGYASVKLGNTYNRLGQYQEAIKSYTRAITFFPKNPVLYNNLAISYGKVGRADDEIMTLQKAITLRPRYATARYNLGIALLKKGKRSEALIQYHEIDKFDAGVATALKKEIDKKEK